jgi:serine protease Do
MQQVSKLVALGLVLGVALFVAFALLVLLGPGRAGSDLKVGTLDPSVTAPAEQLGKAFALVAAHVRPAVVSVYSEKIIQLQAPEFEFPFGDDFFRQFFGPEFPGESGQPRRNRPREYRIPERGTGSGMILNNQGVVLTNYHVVRDVDEINVRLADKHSFEAEIVSTDPSTDVARIRMKGNFPHNLPAVEFGDSDAMQVGDLVMAVGAPFGLAQTVTTGIVSAKGRSGVGLNAYENFLQTDAAINPGNSGGPLANMRGQVIGINSAIATGGVSQFAGVGFAIPINKVKTILPKLMKGPGTSRKTRQ